jgi:hypothetical protein
MSLIHLRHLDYRRTIDVDRANPLPPILHAMKFTPWDRDLETLGVVFVNEMGIAASGLRREFFQLMAEELSNPKLGLLSNNDGRYEVKTGANPELYTLLGRLITIALVNGDVFPITFIKPFYKHLLRLPVDVDDMADVDAQIYTSLMLMKDNPTDDWVIDLIGDQNVTAYIE